MKISAVLLILTIVSRAAQAQDTRHLLVIIRPAQDSMLLSLEDSVRGLLDRVALERYEPAGPDSSQSGLPPDVPDINDTLSKGKEAYEFLNFEKSIILLETTAKRLKAHLDSTVYLTMLREAYLYLALDYLALGRDDAASHAVDAYLCTGGTPALDQNLWQPNLITLIEDRLRTVMRSAVPATMTTIPSGAEVFIDDKDAGAAPVRQNLLPCTHYVRAVMPSFLTKHTTITVTTVARSYTIDLEPSSLAFTDTVISAMQAQELIARYKADGMLLLSSSITRTSLQEIIMIHADIIPGTSPTASSLTFAYRNIGQASQKLAAFIEPREKSPAPSTGVQGLQLDPLPDSAASSQGSWYKNPWLWTAGAVLVSGAVVYAATAGHTGSPAKTGSISVQW